MHDSKNLLTVGVRLRLRPCCPAQGLRDGLLRTFAVARIRQTLVEHHRDVAAQCALDRHRLFWSKEELVSVDMRIEEAAIFGNLPHLGEREYLKASGIGENRTVPAHEAVQASDRRDGLRAGA